MFEIVEHLHVQLNLVDSSPRDQSFYFQLAVVKIKGS